MDMYNWIYGYMNKEEKKRDKFSLQVNIVQSGLASMENT
jgi:hypothetical protein